MTQSALTNTQQTLLTLILNTMSNTVKIKMSNSGSLVTPYTNSPDYGYLTLESIAIAFEGGWMREKKRSCLMRGTIETLNNFVKYVAVNNVATGRIHLAEFLESEIPAEYEKYINKNAISRDAALDQFLKRAGNDGPCLTLGGERIVRFSTYDPTSALVDITVAHDNVDAVAEYRASQQNATAALPKK
jgi:hypothetical protein